MAPVEPRRVDHGRCGLSAMAYTLAYVLLIGAMGYYYFNEAGDVRLPRPRGQYYFESNETQLVLAEAAKAAAQQQRLLTAANAVLLALRSSVAQSQVTDSERGDAMSSSSSSHDSAAAPSPPSPTPLVRDNAELWKLALASSLNLSDVTFPVDDAGQRARLSDYHVRALTAHKVALRMDREEEADIAEMIDYVQLFNTLWHDVAADAFHEEADLVYRTQTQVDETWLAELAEEYMKPSERQRHRRERAKSSPQAGIATPNATDTSTTRPHAVTLNQKLLAWLRTHAATESQAADIRRFLVTQSRLWARRERLRRQQTPGYAFEHPVGNTPADGPHAAAGEGDDMDDAATLSALLTLTDAEWQEREEAAKVGVHVVLAADNGTYSGLHELHFIHAAMRFSTLFDMGPDCQSARFGFLERPRRDPLTLRVLNPTEDAHAIQYVPVLAVTTGIYVSRSAVCTAAVAALPMFAVKSMTFLGTAGVSPLVELGGWSPRATASRLYASDRTLTRHDATSATTAHTAASGGTDLFSAELTDDMGGGGGAVPSSQTVWSRAQVEAATNPSCQSEWSLAAATASAQKSGMTVGESMLRSSPLFRNAPSTRRPRETRTRKVSIGSVCVTAAALLQECGICVEENPRPSLCARPQCSIHSSTTFFGPCDFAQRAGNGYAENMKGAMYFQEFPPVPPAVQAGMSRFWAAQEAIPEYTRVSDDNDDAMTSDAPTSADEDNDDSAHVSYRYNRVPPDSPLVLNCAEVDTSQILAGIRSDVLCREYARALLFPIDAAPTPEAAQALREMRDKVPLTCVQAMEGLGFMTVMSRQYPEVPVAIVRGASNYDAYPLTREEYTEVEYDVDEVRADGVQPTDNASTGATAEPRSRAVSTEPFFQTRAQKRRTLLASRAQRSIDAVAETAAGGTSPNHRRRRRRHGSTAAASQKLRPRNTLVRWVQNESFMPPRDYDAYVRASYRYAIETASAVVLNYFLKENTILP